jgi:hypothetical protein
MQTPNSAQPLSKNRGPTPQEVSFFGPTVTINPDTGRPVGEPREPTPAEKATNRPVELGYGAKLYSGNSTPSHETP